MTHAHRLGHRVVWLVGRASQHAQRLVQDQLAAGTVRKTHYGVLASLADVGPSAQAALADRIGIDRSDMVTLLDTLEELQYVERRADPSDRRRNIVELTEAGSAALAELDQRFTAAEEELLAPLSAADRATLIRLLATVLPESDRARVQICSENCSN